MKYTIFDENLKSLAPTVNWFFNYLGTTKKQFVDLSKTRIAHII